MALLEDDSEIVSLAVTASGNLLYVDFAIDLHRKKSDLSGLYLQSCSRVISHFPVFPTCVCCRSIFEKFDVDFSAHYTHTTFFMTKSTCGSRRSKKLTK